MVWSWIERSVCSKIWQLCFFVSIFCVTFVSLSLDSQWNQNVFVFCKFSQAVMKQMHLKDESFAGWRNFSKRKVFIADITMKGMDAYKNILTYELNSLWFKWQTLGKYTSTIYDIKFIDYNNYEIWNQNCYIRWYRIVKF